MPIAINLTEDDVTAIFHAVKSASCKEDVLIKVKDKLENRFTIDSSRRFFNGFEAMRGGYMYKESMGPKPTDWFLDLILEEFKKAGLERALDALEEHIKHRQKFSRSCKMKIYREIHEKHYKILNLT